MRFLGLHFATHSRMRCGEEPVGLILESAFKDTATWVVTMWVRYTGLMCVRLSVCKTHVGSKKEP